jgi:hypothetical protein
MDKLKLMVLTYGENRTEFTPEGVIIDADTDDTVVFGRDDRPHEVTLAHVYPEDTVCGKFVGVVNDGSPMAVYARPVEPLNLSERATLALAGVQNLTLAEWQEVHTQWEIEGNPLAESANLLATGRFQIRLQTP